MKKLLPSFLFFGVILISVFTFFGQTPGTEKWNFLTSGVIASSPAIGADGTIYIGSGTGDYKLHALRPDGTEKWYFTTGSDVDSSPAIGLDGTIYVGSYDDYIYAINPDGSEKWRFYVAHYVQSSPAIGTDGTIYVGSGSPHKLFAINPDGSMKWSFTAGGEISYSSPVIGLGEIIYIGSADQYLYAINPDGTLKWSYFIGGTTNSPAIGTDGTIYVGSTNGYLYALYPDGTPKWTFLAGGSVGSPAIGLNAIIYVGAGGTLYAVSSNGSPIWAYSTGSICTSSPAIGGDGTIYVESSNYLFAINPNGSPKWNFVAGGSLCSSSPAIGSDGTIYFGSNDYKLYAIYSESGGLANSQWPMFHRDPKHTGNINLYQFGFDFPIQGYSPYNAPVTAVLDHSEFDARNVRFYGKSDGLVRAFNGETGNKIYGSKCYDKKCTVVGYRNENFSIFLSGVLNYPPPDNDYLWYDGHPGYDYSIPIDTDIKATEKGKLYKAKNDPVNGGGWNKFHTFYIDHENGYTSWYLHCKNLTADVEAEITQKGFANVIKGQIVAKSGNYPSGAYHLHFEVRLNGFDHKNVIDPYKERLW